MTYHNISRCVLYFQATSKSKPQTVLSIATSKRQRCGKDNSTLQQIAKKALTLQTAHTVSIYQIPSAQPSATSSTDKARLLKTVCIVCCYDQIKSLISYMNYKACRFSLKVWTPRFSGGFRLRDAKVFLVVCRIA